tara:strand:- start:48 stop:437 length:390 start_codon:yes stop_codon:yes gene_type:complete
MPYLIQMKHKKRAGQNHTADKHYLLKLALFDALEIIGQKNSRWEKSEQYRGSIGRGKENQGCSQQKYEEHYTQQQQLSPTNISKSNKYNHGNYNRQNQINQGLYVEYLKKRFGSKKPKGKLIVVFKKVE